MEEYRDIYPALNALYNISKRVQNSMSISEKKFFSLRSYLKDYCTIRVSTCRRGGHDYGLSKFLCKTELKSCIISYCKVMSTILQGELSNYLEKNPNDGNFNCDFLNQIPQGYDLSSKDVVVINNASLYSKGKEKTLYDHILMRIGESFYESPFYIIFVH